MEHTKLFPSSTFIDLTGQRFHRLRVLRFAAEHWRKSYTLSLRWEGKRGRIRRVKYWKTALAILAVLSTSLAVAEDFKTTNGKEYKNATVTRVEPDGIVVKTKSGISKVYFLELPKDVQERFHYDKDQATAYAADQNAKLGALGKQQE